MSGLGSIRGGRLREVFERAVLRARQTSSAQWVVWTQPSQPVDPLEFFAHETSEERFFWQWEEGGEAVAARGIAHEIEASGVDRFEIVRDQIDALRADLHLLHGSSPAPLWLGGFGFEDEAAPDPEWKSFPPARWILPEISLSVIGGHCQLRLIQRVEAGADLEREVQRAIRSLPDAVAHVDVPGRLDRDGCDPAADLALAPCGARASQAGSPIWEPGPEYRVQADRSHLVYRGQVADAVREIADAGLEKVVLARSLRVTHNGRFEIVPLLERLRHMYPSCAVFAVARGDDVFVAATPEHLVSLSGDEVSAMALAGSAPRGQSPDEDEAIGHRLLASPKERAEHAIVVREILAALTAGGLCADCTAGSEPMLRRVEGIQHLETSIRARLVKAACSKTSRAAALLDLARSLHPTPAVGGTPRLAASEWIRQREDLVRGWYAGTVGWMDEDGNGHLRVALRSGLIRNGTGPDGTRACARLFAGAGIVAASLPSAELEETRIKLRALLAPLTEI